MNYQQPSALQDWQSRNAKTQECQLNRNPSSQNRSGTLNLGRTLGQILFTIIVSLTLSIASADTQKEPLIAAAADLQFALSEIAQQYQTATGKSVRLVFGSSGNFYRQIHEGAPFDLFLSADERYVSQLASAGKTRDNGTLYALGRIVLIAPSDSPLTVDGELSGLQQALSRGEIKKFAIANPEHAPYGERAAEALQHAGLWNALQGKLVLGENVAQAAQFATSGNAQGGIIAYSLALSPAVASHSRFALIPQHWHQPLRQRMVLLNNASEASSAFYDYLQQPEARKTLRTYGFSLPE
jgi:molybdate transport system substrate-binding protein